MTLSEGTADCSGFAGRIVLPEPGVGGEGLMSADESYTFLRCASTLEMPKKNGWKCQRRRIDESCFRKEFVCC